MPSKYIHYQNTNIMQKFSQEKYLCVFICKVHFEVVVVCINQHYNHTFNQ